MRETERCRASSWCDFLVCDRARLGTLGGASPPEEEEVDERGVVVMVADLLGRPAVETWLGSGPIGDTSVDDAWGDVIGLVVEVSSPDRKEDVDDDDDTEPTSGAV